MLARHWFLLPFLAAGLVSAGAAVDRDWAAHPAIVEVDTAADIFAIGDVHSDYARLALAMKGAGLIERVPDNSAGVEWRAGKSVLVVTGDMIDKGPRAVDVLRLLRSLQNSAAAQGGRVIVLAGNHEAEFLAFPASVKSQEFARQLAAEGIRASDVAACRGEIGEFLCALPFGARVNEWFFSHGGNTKGRSLHQLSADLRASVMEHGFASGELVGNYSLLEARLNGTGPGREPWIDAGLPGRSEQQLLSQHAAALGVKHIVQGHVPSPVTFADGVERHAGEMFQRYGLLFLIDTGMSEGVDGSLGAVLHITPQAATAICPSGKQTRLWDPKSQPDVGRAAPCRN